MVSMNSPNSSVKVRPNRLRTKSTNARRYDNELKGNDDPTQGELSPIATQQSSNMERISVENKQLQQALKEWEIRYDEQMRDFVQQHNVVESQLRNKNSNLEDYASRAKDRVAELENQLQRMQQALEGAESANLQLERRIEIMSEILTTTRTEPVEPGRPRVRPRSMLPRASSNRCSWIGSPERTPDFGALSSPSVSSKRDSTIEMFEPLDRIVSKEVWTSSPRQESEQDEPRSARSSTSAEQPPERRPRRMRRFGGGSYGPKPLILPHTSQIDHNTMTAPPLERHEVVAALPFRRSIHLDNFDSPTVIRPRAATSTSENALHLINSSESAEPYDSDFKRVLNLAHTDNESFSFTSVSEHPGLVSRNLLDELHALKVDDGQIDDEGSLGDEMDESPFTLYSGSPHVLGGAPILVPRWQREELELSPLSGRGAFNPALESIMGPLHNGPDLDETPRAFIRKSAPVEDLSHLSALDRLRRTFGEILHSPGDVARAVVHATQQRMHIPAALENVQWWVVGLLWRPIVRRQQQRDESLHNSPIPASVALIDNLAYGTIYTSPGSGIRRRAGMAGPGKKRAGKDCPKDESLLSKHSPRLWLKFSLTLAYAVGLAFTKGPGTLLQSKCGCEKCRKEE